MRRGIRLMGTEFEQSLPVIPLIYTLVVNRLQVSGAIAIGNVRLPPVYGFKVKVLYLLLV